MLNNLYLQKLYDQKHLILTEKARFYYFFSKLSLVLEHVNKYYMGPKQINQHLTFII